MNIRKILKDLGLNAEEIEPRIELTCDKCNITGFLYEEELTPCKKCGSPASRIETHTLSRVEHIPEYSSAITLTYNGKSYEAVFNVLMREWTIKNHFLNPNPWK